MWVLCFNLQSMRHLTIQYNENLVVAYQCSCVWACLPMAQVKKPTLLDSGRGRFMNSEKVTVHYFDAWGFPFFTLRQLKDWIRQMHQKLKSSDPLKRVRGEVTLPKSKKKKKKKKRYRLAKKKFLKTKKQNKKGTK